MALLTEVCSNQSLKRFHSFIKRIKSTDFLDGKLEEAYNRFYERRSGKLPSATWAGWIDNVVGKCPQ